jgi:peroxiredoxin (alkyl hydroperoxide reductase subunit C)
MKIPLLADTNHSISKDYGVLIEGEGIDLRCVVRAPISAFSL